MIPKDTKWITEELKKVSEKYHPRIDELFEKGLSFLIPEDREKMRDLGSLTAFVYDNPPDEFLIVAKEWQDLTNREAREKIEVLDAYSRMEWEKLENDPEKVMKDVEETIRIYLDRLFSTAMRLGRAGKDVPGMIREEDGSLSFDLEYITESALTLVDEHRAFFDHQRDEEIDGLIREIIENDENLKLRISTEENETLYLAQHPSDFLSPIDRASWKVFDGTLNHGEPRSIEMIHRAKNHPAYYANVGLDLTSLKNIDFNGEKGLTPFDREVHDAIITLFVAGNIFITVNMIYQTMNGKTGSHASQNWKDDIWTSIRKLRHIDMYIDASDEAIKDKRITDPKLGSPDLGWPIIDALPSNEVINGQKTQGIIIRSVPILLRYSSQKNQIARFDMKLLDTPTAKKTKDTIVIEGFLRRKINMIISLWKSSPKDHKESYKIIKYTDIYELIDTSSLKTQATINNKKRDIREHAKNTLDFFIKSKVDGFITGYEEVSEEGKKRPYGLMIKFSGDGLKGK